MTGELIRLGSAFAIKLGATEDGWQAWRGCYSEAQALVRARPTDMFGACGARMFISLKLIASAKLGV